MNFKNLTKIASLLAPAALAGCQQPPQHLAEIRIQGTTERFEYRKNETVKLLSTQEAGKTTHYLKPSIIREWKTPHINPSFEIKTRKRIFMPSGKQIIGPEIINKMNTFQDRRMHVMIQYDGNLTTSERQELKKKGIIITSPVSTKTYMASIPTKSPDLEELLKTEDHNPRYVGDIKKEDKLGEIWNKNEAGQAKGLQVIFHKDIDYEQARTKLESMGAIIKNTLKEANSFGITATDNSPDANKKLAEKLAELDSVYTVGQSLPLEKMNLDSRSFGNVDKLQQKLPDLNGSGVTILVYDGGYADPDHPDVKGRTIMLEDVVSWYNSSHATHVNCIVASDGTNTLKFLEDECGLSYMEEEFEKICEEYLQAAENGDTSKFEKLFKGMAPGATTITEDHGDCGNYCIVENPNQMLKKNLRARIKGAVISTNSIGPNIYANYPGETELYGHYDSVATIMDMLVKGELGNDPITVLFAAGNERSWDQENTGCMGEDDSHPGYCTIGGGPATGKNIITVGAAGIVDEDGQLKITKYTSWGPLSPKNARVKPTIIDFGGSKKQGMISCSTYGTYTTMAGTSMATPGTAGKLALLVEALRNSKENPNFDPNPWLLQSLIVNSAQDMKVGDNRYVDFKTGFGYINANKANKLVEKGNFITKTMKETGDVHSYFFQVKDKENIEVTMAYPDFPGKFIINDLDVQIISPSGKSYQPHVLNPSKPNEEAQRMRDDENNIEKITVDNPEEIEKGMWEVRVTGYDLVTGPQEYALAFSQSPFKPKTAEAVRMDEQGKDIAGQISLELQVRECPECQLLRELGPIKGPMTTLEPGEKLPFGEIFPDFTPTKDGVYTLKTKFLNRYGNVHENPDGSKAENESYFVVRDKLTFTKPKDGWWKH